MNKPLHKLLAEAAKALPPQGPATDYSIFQKEAVKMAHRGHTPRTIVDSLIQRKELAPSERRPAAAAISKLLARHFKTA